jgi:hypothetical protein
MTATNAISQRELTKGWRAYAAGRNDTQFRRLFGFKGIQDFNLDRVGEIDATELYQGPNVPVIDEPQYYWSQQYAGTKRVQPITLTINKVPTRVIPDANHPNVARQIAHPHLVYWYTMDEHCHWSFRGNSGWEYTFRAQIQSINKTAEENNLWNGTVTLLVTSFVIYRPIPINYAPWRNTDPIFGPPGVDSVVRVTTFGGAPNANSSNINVGDSAPLYQNVLNKE